MVQNAAPSSTYAGLTVAEAAASFARNLDVRGRSPLTARAYGIAIAKFDAYLAAQGMPRTIEHVRREHIEAFLLSERAAGRAANTILARYAGIRALFAWLVDEDEIPVSPMLKMKQPAMGETITEVVSDAQQARLFKACEGRDFADRRAMALARLFLASGVRRAEMAGMKVDDVEFLPSGANGVPRGVVRVTGKGNRERLAVFAGRKVVAAVDAYLRARRKHKHAAEPWLWLGHRARLTDAGIEEALRQRWERAGLGRMRLHQLRHTWAAQNKSRQMSDESLRRLGGWRPGSGVIERYGAVAAIQRAIEDATRLAVDEL